MMGITGIIARTPPDAIKASLRPMTACMAREVFDSSGSWIGRELGVGVGWVCHRDSFSDCMPVWNERKDICLVFMGENFMDRAELGALKSRGHDFDAENATSLVHLYEEKGPGFVEHLNGWFGGLVVDLRDRLVMLFNDRYGLHRIYVHETADGMFFSSEAKSLLRILPAVRRIDPVGLAEFVSSGCPLQRRTLFAGISLLPPASRWIFRPLQRPRKETYFRSETWECQQPLSKDEYYDELKNTFRRILPRYVSGRRPIGVSLTGGLDSRMIMAWLPHDTSTRPCYSFGGGYRDCADVRIARKVACRRGYAHQTISVDGEFLKHFAPLAQKAVYVSDGAMDVTGSVELYVNQIARTIAPVRLTGNYGSEILRRNIAFKPRPLSSMIYDPEFARLASAAAITYGHEAHGHPLSFIAFKQMAWHHPARLAVEQSQVTLRTPYLDNELVRLAYQVPLHQAAEPELCLRLIADGDAALSRIPTDRGLLYRPTPVVTRVSNLYHEAMFKAEYAFDYGMPQWLVPLNRLLSPLGLERTFLGRHKFQHFRVWYRGPLAACLKEVLLDPRARARPHVHGRGLENLIADHIQGRKNYTTELTKLLTIELVHRHLIEQKWL